MTTIDWRTARCVERRCPECRAESEGWEPAELHCDICTQPVHNMATHPALVCPNCNAVFDVEGGEDPSGWMVDELDD